MAATVAMYTGQCAVGLSDIGTSRLKRRRNTEKSFKEGKLFKRIALHPQRDGSKPCFFCDSEDYQYDKRTDFCWAPECMTMLVLGLREKIPQLNGVLRKIARLTGSDIKDAALSRGQPGLPELTPGAPHRRLPSAQVSAERGCFTDYC